MPTKKTPARVAEIEEEDDKFFEEEPAPTVEIIPPSTDLGTEFIDSKTNEKPTVTGLG